MSSLRPRPFFSTAVVAVLLLLTHPSLTLIKSVDAFQGPSAVHAALQQPPNDEIRSSGRRSFFREAAAATVVASSGGLAFLPTWAWAVEDLAMPTADKQQKMDNVRARIIIKYHHIRPLFRLKYSQTTCRNASVGNECLQTKGTLFLP